MLKEKQICSFTRIEWVPLTSFLSPRIVWQDGLKKIKERKRKVTNIP